MSAVELIRLIHERERGFGPRGELYVRVNILYLSGPLPLSRHVYHLAAGSTTSFDPSNKFDVIYVLKVEF